MLPSFFHENMSYTITTDKSLYHTSLAVLCGKDEPLGFVRQPSHPAKE